MKKLIFFIALVFTFMSCDMSNSTSEYHGFSDLLWQKTDQPTLDFEIKKEARYSIYVELRLIYGYAFRNIKMAMYMSKDSDREKLFPIDFKVRNEDDSFKGDVMGDFIDIQEMIISDTTLQAGKYSFQLEQMMDDKTLPFVGEIGLTLKEIVEE